VPLSDFSLGSDTSLNALVEACDAIKQSAAASRNRVFVVETQGGQSGYIATLGALAVGAVLVYTPEDGISLKLLQEDVEFMRRRYELDPKGRSEGRLVIRYVYIVQWIENYADSADPRSQAASTRPRSSPRS
jgi:6-phosphofructokinase 1